MQATRCGDLGRQRWREGLFQGEDVASRNLSGAGKWLGRYIYYLNFNFGICRKEQGCQLSSNHQSIEVSF